MPTPNSQRQGIRQEQFLSVMDRHEAAARFNRFIQHDPLGTEQIALEQALDRVLGENVLAPVDVPGFDRAAVDGFAVNAADTFGASGDSPRRLMLTAETLTPGVKPTIPVQSGLATPISTGSMVPRGADAIVMIEHTEVDPAEGEYAILVKKAVAPGLFVAFAGSDVARGEMVLRQGQLLSSREIGILAATGLARVPVFRRPRVAIISTGNEIISPGAEPRPGSVYDSNSAILAAAVTEAGAEAIPMGIVNDDEIALDAAIASALNYDMVLLSGGTSKGVGDISYRCVARLRNPGIIAHGVALKPGKPICLAVSDGKPVVVLPGFPTSAIFSFHEFIAPVLRRLGGIGEERHERINARLPVKIQSELGRTEYLLVNLVPGEKEASAYPSVKGSGAVTAFSQADGFITVDQQTEFLPANTPVEVQLIGRHTAPTDLIFIGSQCAGLEFLIDRLRTQGLTVKALYVGSMGGFAAARRGECDFAGVHLLDSVSGEYNRHLVVPGLTLVKGYQRMQGIVFRRQDERFVDRSVDEIMAAVLSKNCTMVSRNAGSGTRILIDQLLKNQQPPGYGVQPKSHNAVAVAVAQGRADWGVAIDTVARQYDLGFLPLQEEHYDFLLPQARRDRPAVQQFLTLLAETETREQLRALGFKISQNNPKIQCGDDHNDS